MNAATVHRIGSNGIEADLVQPFCDRIENLMDQLATEKGEYMQRCKSIREDITLVLTEAKDAGIPKKAFKAVIKTRELEQKLEAIRDDLEAEQQETYDQIRHALGDLADTPLGGATLSKAADRPSA
jgi:F0F1-type ATP synthase membrane subunit b/b'